MHLIIMLAPPIVILVGITLFGRYDIKCFMKITQPMHLTEFLVFLRSSEHQTAMRFGGAIYLWHKKIKRTREATTNATHSPPQRRSPHHD